MKGNINYNERLDEVFKTLNNNAREERASCTERNNWEGYNAAYERLENEAKQAILNWHNKQIEEAMAKFTLKKGIQYAVKASDSVIVITPVNKLKESK